jgi:outer membrane protein OmpA-like peptidoglycan-associated protein
MRRLSTAVGFVALAFCLVASAVRADEPFVGVDLGMALPVYRFNKQVDIGANIAPYAGYRINLTDRVAFSVLGQPQFTGFPSSTCDPNDKGLNRCIEGDQWTGIFAITAGPRLSYTYGEFEGFIGGQGGWYTGVHGPIDDDGGGFNVSGGANYAFGRGTSAGLFVRYDDSRLDAFPGADQDARFITLGFGVQHAFLPPPPVQEAPPPPPTPAPEPPVQRKIILRGINFDFDKANIRPDAEPILNEAVAVLDEEPDITVVVEGHTDSRGTEAYNEKLSLRRAQAVYDYFVDAGISPLRLRVRGYGELRPVASNDTDDGRAQNRRVELRVEEAP